jgi:hypothetical protein
MNSHVSRRSQRLIRRRGSTFALFAADFAHARIANGLILIRRDQATVNRPYETMFCARGHSGSLQPSARRLQFDQQDFAFFSARNPIVNASDLDGSSNDGRDRFWRHDLAHRLLAYRHRLQPSGPLSDSSDTTTFQSPECAARLLCQSEATATAPAVREISSCRQHPAFRQRHGASAFSERYIQW